MKISAIILTVDQRDWTLQCLASLMKLKEPSFSVLVWDNGSHDETVEAVRKEFPQVLVHRNPSNMGVASGRNAAAELAIQMVNPSYLLFLDNDMLVEPGFVSALLEPFSEESDLGQTQAKLRFMYDRQRLNDGGGAKINFVLWQITPVGFGEIDRGQYDTVRPCISCGGAMMVRTNIFQKLGGFDTAFDPFGPEDLDFSLRLQKAGYKAMYIPQAVAFHKASHTYGGDYDEVYAQYKVRQWFLFMKRHATIVEKMAFYLFGVPFLAIKVVLREGRRGNFAAIRGILRGTLGYIRSK